MKMSIKILIVAGLAVIAVAAVAIKQGKNVGNDRGSASPAAEAGVKVALPRLVDLGAGKCIPCKMMAPILEELKREYAGRINVEFIDVWENPDAAKSNGVEIIPTQIFYDAAGKELFRHQGFFAKADILAKWKELGLELGSTEVKGESPKAETKAEM